MVVTVSTFHDIELLFTGVAPPPYPRNAPADRTACIAANGPLPMSASGVVSPAPLWSIAIPLLTSSTSPGSSAKMPEASE